MINVWIGDQVRPIADFRESWLFEQLERHAQHRNAPVCVRIEIRTEHASLVLVTPGCPGGRGTGDLNPTEKRLVEDWRRAGLTEPGWAPSALIEFLRRVN